MKKPGKDRDPKLHLPPGYHAHLDPDVLILSRPDGSRVAHFSIRGFVVEIVEQAAWEDYDVQVSEGTLLNSVLSPSPLRSL